MAGTMSERWRVVIIGGGFGGLSAAQQLNSDLVDVTLIDRRNYHLFQPLLYQVATGSLSAGEIASPLRSVLSRYKNTRVWLGTVADVDTDSRQVVLKDGATVPYDSLIVADDVGFPGHFVSPKFRRFGGKASFSTATGNFSNYRPKARLLVKLRCFDSYIPGAESS